MIQTARNLGAVHTHTHTHTGILRNSRNKFIIRKQTLLFYVLMGAILLMGIGYASINSITGEIQGTVIANVQDGVFITNVEYANGVDADSSTSKIHKYVGTMMQSTIELSASNPNSEITYKVTVYNNSKESCIFLNTLYDKNNLEFYDNLNIIFEIKENGFKVGDVINAHETKDIYITFKYKDGIIPGNTVLNSYLNFIIKVPNRLVVAQNVAATGNYLGSSITKNKIETIKFELGETEPVGTKLSFDASEKRDKSIMGYYTDENANGLYELTFSSDELIIANKNAQYLFQYLTSLKEIEFNNFSTFDVTSMDHMFSECSALQELDVSNFNTSKCTTMLGMFMNCNSLKRLDLSNFNTENVKIMQAMFHRANNLTELKWSDKFKTGKVTNMTQMFNSCSNLKKLDLSNFDTSNVTNMAYMFYSCPALTSLDCSSFDTTNVTDMSYMFYSSTNLASIDVSNFNTKNVTNMNRMFAYTKVESLNMSAFNTSKVKDMAKMFSGCNRLARIYVSEFNSTTNTGWTTLATTSSSQMFENCSKLVGGNGTTYNSSHLDATYARIDTSETPGYFTNILDKQ